jgi:predicted phosphodiesterase
MRYDVPLPKVLHHVVSEDELKGRKLFIVGDIHGCLEEFQSLLQKAEVSDEKYLIICCGDLINKGPKNCETVDFIRRLTPSNILSVRGNHDEKVISQFFYTKSSLCFIL